VTRKQILKAIAPLSHLNRWARTPYELRRDMYSDPNGGRTTYLGRPTIVVPFVLEYVSLDDIDSVTRRLKELSI